MDPTSLISLLVSLGVVGAIATLFKSLISSKDEQIKWLQEDNKEMREVLNHVAQTSQRAISIAEQATRRTSGGRS